jgi:membrane protein implicated in regulation of membrane protease activity
MSTTFYFLWPGIAAGAVGVLLYFFPALGFPSQIVLFSVMAVISTVLWKRLAPESWTSAEPHPTLNRRTAQYEGRRARVAANFTGGRGAVQVDDTRWSAKTDDGSDPEIGESVTIIGSDGTVLLVSRKSG